MEFQPFLDWEFLDWLVAGKEQVHFGIQCKDLWLELFKTFAFFSVFLASVKIIVASEP